MTYEEKVHQFGLRWLLANPGKFSVRLRDLDLTRQITLYEEGTEYGCSCDYDFEMERGLVVPMRSGPSYRVELDLCFSELIQAIIEESDKAAIDIGGLNELVIDAQNDQITELKAQVTENLKLYTTERAAHNALKNGLKTQTALWTFLRNLYVDLGDYQLKTASSLNKKEMLELCTHLYRELDLWFNSAIGEETDKTVLVLNTSRNAVVGKAI